MQEIQDTIAVGEVPLIFSLNRKSAVLGSVTVDHWWMPVTELYRQREHADAAGGNYEAVIEAYWNLCVIEGSDHEEDVRQSYLLARLLPLARSQGSRRVFADAHLESREQGRRRGRREALARLEELLRAAREICLTWSEFRKASAKVLGPTPMSREAQTLYRDSEAQLFSASLPLFEESRLRAVEVARTTWQNWMRTIGRRGGAGQAKYILDVLSYEARAALHRCYSAAWVGCLLPHLTRKYGLDEDSLEFLRLWHLDQFRPARSGEPAHNHLFHGHVFALHPATGEFLRTASGRALVGEWLKARRQAEQGQKESEGRLLGERAFERLLGAIQVALYDYAGIRDQFQFERRSTPPTVDPSTAQDVPEDGVLRRRKRRRKLPE